MRKRIAAAILLSFILLFAVEAFSADVDIFSRADSALAAKQYLQAKDLYRQVFLNSKDPSDTSRALLGIAKSDYSLKNYYEAGTSLKRFFAVYPNSPFSGEAHLIWGLSFLHVQKYKAAEDQLDRVTGPFLERADIGKAEAALLQGDIGKSDKLLSKLDRNTYENNNRVLYLRALILSRKGLHDLAIQTINRIPQQVLKEENMAVSKAVVFYNARRYEEAKSMLISIISTPSSRVEAIQAKRTLFQIYDVENNLDEALKLALELMNYGSTDDLKMKIIVLFDKKGDPDSAFRYLTYVRDKKIQSEEIEHRLKKLIDEKNPRADEFLLRYFIYISPDSPYALEAAEYMAGKGYKSQARRLLQAAVRGRNGGGASLKLAEMLIAEKKYAEAKKIVIPITTESRYSGQASLVMYQLLEKEGKSTEAAQYRTKALKALEAQRDYAGAGDLYVRAGNNAEALKNYLRASVKGDTAAMVKAADIFYMNSKTAKAKQYYKKALDAGIKDPKNRQWADYQYGKLTGNDEYLNKAKEGGGAVSDAADLMTSK